jgi:hypothetical protein
LLFFMAADRQTQVPFTPGADAADTPPACSRLSQLELAASETLLLNDRGIAHHLSQVNRTSTRGTNLLGLSLERPLLLFRK